MQEKPAMRKEKKPITQRTKPLESKAKLSLHSNFMIAPKILKYKKSIFMVVALWNYNSWGKVYKGISVDEINNPLI